MLSAVAYSPSVPYSTPALLLLVFLLACCLLLYYLFYPAIVAARSAKDRLTEAIILVQDHDDNPTASEPCVLSVIIPAYDEETRLPVMLSEAYSYLSKPDCIALRNLGIENPARAAIEWIVVDDGSRDATSNVYRHFVNHGVSSDPPTRPMLWKLVQLPQNSGKGAAVRNGMLQATGKYCLMVDADGATAFGPGLEALTSCLPTITHSSTCVVLGSRASYQNDPSSSNGNSSNSSESPGNHRSVVRSLLMHAFHICVVVFVGTKVRDTQCGFKLFGRDAAQQLFRSLHLRRWAFDTELLFLAEQLQYTIHEVVVPWHEVEGSKLNTGALNLALVSIGMLRDMVCVRLCYMMGVWTIRQKAQ
jgi:dolichyl-phosphate beta-glucosyltransferase